MSILLFCHLLFSDHLTVHAIKAHVRFLSDDLLQGRDTTSPGQKIAARYIASQFASFGLVGPYAKSEDSYYQAFNLFLPELDEEQCILRLGDQELKFKQGFRYTGLQPKEGAVTGAALFIGYGYRSKSAGYNAYEGLDLKGKVVIIIDGYPPHLAKKFKDSQRRRKHLHGKKVRWVQRAGAEAIVFLAGPALGVQDFSPKAEELPSVGKLTLKVAEYGGTAFPQLELDESGTRYLLGKHGATLRQLLALIAETEKPQNLLLDTLPASLKTTLNHDRRPTENVLGVLAGTDSELKHEYIVITAHYDHLGIQGKQIFNGADDNASGTALLIELARRLSEHPPKRSVLFMALTGEEKGLLGSRYFVENSPFPLTQLVANLNMDMVGRNDTYSLNLIPAKNEDISTLNLWVKEVNSKLPHPFQLLEELDKYHRRSDHFNFIRKDIPALLFFSGDHGDYHKSTDTWEKVNYEKMERVGNLIEKLVLHVGNEKKRPVFINRPAKSEEATQKENP